MILWVELLIQLHLRLVWKFWLNETKSKLFSALLTMEVNDLEMHVTNSVMGTGKVETLTLFPSLLVG